MVPKRAASKALPSASVRDPTSIDSHHRVGSGGRAGATSFVGIYDGGGGDSGDALVLHCPIDPLDRSCARKDMAKIHVCIAALFGRFDLKG